ncbi:GNAT family N-acetyltransferase [Exiguobacterium sp. s141]|uniref:GNAT family N-acetyltransferase n=1 Tax=Exiguobacterium sp. s141 TaxID=2751240 RepID=UPI001BE714C8|nr:GNAT family N-acetyltransferase [Exiguobacterium sp. s141]
MELIRWNDLSGFEERVMPHLLEHEAENSLMIGVLDAIKQGRYESYHQLTVEDDGDVLAILQVTPPHPLNYVLVTPEREDDVLRLLVPELLNGDIPFTEVVSQADLAMNFYTLWYILTAREPKVFMEQGLYRLDHVNDIPLSEGSMRRATEEDETFLVKAYNAFEKETGLRVSSKKEAKQKIATMLENQEVYVWEVDGKVVSCAKKSRETANGVTVSFVYTPKALRKRGYARSLVAELSRELLTSKQYCTLYTDLSNPTSNKIYKEVGYQKIFTSAWIRLPS